MSKKTFPFLMPLCCLVFYIAEAQTTISKTDSSIIGVWKGSSICQIKNSPCHDEIVVYYISKSKGDDEFDILAKKIVNGTEVSMGTISCKFDNSKNQLSSTSSNGVWKFNLKGNVLDGTLIFQGNLYRVIKVTKQN